MVKDAMNPFDSELDPTHLYNIGTGEDVSDNTEYLLFTINKIHIWVHWKSKSIWDENTSTKSAHICIRSRWTQTFLKKTDKVVH